MLDRSGPFEVEQEVVDLYTGTLIEDLFALVERAEHTAGLKAGKTCLPAWPAVRRQ
jgi:hypothetical protein